MLSEYARVVCVSKAPVVEHCLHIQEKGEFKHKTSSLFYLAVYLFWKGGWYRGL